MMYILKIFLDKLLPLVNNDFSELEQILRNLTHGDKQEGIVTTEALTTTTTTTTITTVPPKTTEIKLKSKF